MSIALRVCLVVAVPSLAFGQYRSSGRYDLPANDGPSNNVWSADSPGGASQHATWPTREMRNRVLSAYSESIDPRIQPASHPQAPVDLDLHEQQTGRVVRQEVWEPPAHRMQKAAPLPWIAPYQTKVKATVLSGDGDELGLVDVDLRHTLAVPRVSGLTVTPGIAVSFVDGPLRTDLPPQLVGNWVELQLHRQLSPRWGMQLAVAPGVYNDFRNFDSDAFRITARALGFYGLSEQTQFVFGVVYLDREDVAVLPAVGLMHQAGPNWKYELIFPRPRVLYRVLAHPNGGEGWVYIAGEFGGGSWAIERASGRNDVVTYGDLRLIGGYEWQGPNGRSWLVEGGWVFSRSVEYQSGIGDYDPDSTGMIRAGLTF